MTTNAIFLGLVFFIAFILGCITLPQIVKFARVFHLYDNPNARKVHALPIPRLGGVAFLPCTIIAICAVMALASRFSFGLDDLLNYGSVYHFVAYYAGVFLLFVLGIIDDLDGVSYKTKFLVQIVAAFLLCISGLWLASLGHILFIDEIPFWIGMPLTVFFVVYITNAINLIDGIDGLASGLSIIAFAVTTVVCVLSGDLLWAVLSIAHSGVLCSFWGYNVFGGKYKIFMGDTGSLTLGYTLSFVMLHFWQANPIWNPILHNLGIITLSSLVIPMFDVVRVFASRVRDGRNPFLPDKNHIHHKLMRAGLSGYQTMATLLLITILIIVINYVLSNINQTLMVVMDVLLFVVMHWTINFFIFRKEKQTDNKWDRAFK